MDEPFPAFFDVTLASPSRGASASSARGGWLSDLDVARSFSTPLEYEPQGLLSPSDLSAANPLHFNCAGDDFSNAYLPSPHSTVASYSSRPMCTSRWSASSASSDSSSSSVSEPSFASNEPSAAATNSAISSLNAYGIPVPSSDPSVQAWRCAYPRCSSRATFTRGCDLRKHYNRHSKHLYCRFPGCPRSQLVATAIAQSCNGPMSVGFSSEKDLERHEAQHNPTIKCEYLDRNGNKCGRVFSRVDNMKDHVKRIHKARR